MCLSQRNWIENLLAKILYSYRSGRPTSPFGIPTKLLSSNGVLMIFSNWQKTPPTTYLTTHLISHPLRFCSPLSCTLSTNHNASKMPPVNELAIQNAINALQANNKRSICSIALFYSVNCQMLLNYL